MFKIAWQGANRFMLVLPVWWAWESFSSDVQSHVIIPAHPSRERGQTFSGLEQHLRWILGFKSGGVLSLDSSGNESTQLVSICTCSCSYVLCGLVIRNILLLQHREIPGVWLSCSTCWQVIGKSQVPFWEVASNIYDQVLLSLHTRKTLSKNSFMWL